MNFLWLVVPLGLDPGTKGFTVPVPAQREVSIVHACTRATEAESTGTVSDLAMPGEGAVQFKWRGFPCTKKATRRRRSSGTRKSPLRLVYSVTMRGNWYAK